ncbi:MAG: cobyric acid synthase [Synergistaceae bacterium]|jgi:adenosylcobyric acid synthase|nr:cobyric acid synthase [Synergistaceae bacterium]
MKVFFDGAFAMKGVMIQGTSSDAGKSFLVTGLCRILSDRGYRVCPFKSQNMSNNSCVTRGGLEMGRAQAAQAEAARLEPEVFMNPILLKPRMDTSSEIVLMGKVFDVPAERDYYRTFTMNEGLATLRAALSHIGKNFDVILIEGAGSPAEVNLNETEIVNMRVAREANVPVILATDVDRGGSLASVVGTLELLGQDRERVGGIVFNKFRGDLSLFEPAVRWTEERTGIRVVGVLPWLPDVRVPGEDSLSVNWRGSLRGGNRLAIGVVRLPCISNHTDMEFFASEDDVDLIELAEPVGDESDPVLSRLDAVIIPGTKNAVQDMRILHASGLARRLRDFYAEGGFVFGVCGGYQMLGERIDDRHLRENTTIREIQGLGLLPVVTTFEPEKTTIRSEGHAVHPHLSPSRARIEGYEIHFGETRRLRADNREEERFHPLFMLDGREDGLGDGELRAAGTYLHDVFRNDAFRASWLNALRRKRNLPERPPVDTTGIRERAYDALAERMKESLDVEYIFKLAGL